MSTRKQAKWWYAEYLKFEATSKWKVWKKWEGTEAQYKKIRRFVNK